MNRASGHSGLIAGLLAIALALPGNSVAAGAQPLPGPAATRPEASTERALLKRYCMPCHNEVKLTGGLKFFNA